MFVSVLIVYGVETHPVYRRSLRPSRPLPVLRIHLESGGVSLNRKLCDTAPDAVEGHYNNAKLAGQSEDDVDQQLKERMKELGEAITKSLSDSGPVSAVVSRIKEDGYDLFMVLEATIGVSKKGEKISDKASAVSTFSMGTSESARWMGESVRVRLTKPDGTPHPGAGKTGRVRKLLLLGAQMRAVVEVENDFILVSVESLEVLQHPSARSLSD